jgi:hypothetical protein
VTIFNAFVDGVRRVNRAPAILFGLLLVTFLLALPLGLTLRGMIETHLGSSLAADAAADGVNYDWWQEFRGQASGLGTTFEPAIIGFAAVLRNLSDFADNRPRTMPILGAIVAYLVVWAFLIGGVIDRYARQRPTRSAGFFAASGIFFFRFLRLAIIAALAYYVLFVWIHVGLEGLYRLLTRDMAVERNAFVVRLALYAAFGLGLVCLTLLFDYAKVRAVVEDRRSMIGAVLASGRFIARRPVRVLGLYFLNVALFAIVVLIYALVAPGAGSAGATMWIAFALGQLYVLGRLWTKLAFYASEVALFQSELAHAEYAAAPPPVWPESPAAEAIANAFD